MVARITRLWVGCSLIAEVSLGTVPAALRLVHRTSLVSVCASWTLVLVNVGSPVDWAVVTNWAWIVLVVLNATSVTVVTLWAVHTVLRLVHSLEVVVGAFIAWDRGKGPLWAEVTLRTDPHDTVVLNAVVACLARDTREL